MVCFRYIIVNNLHKGDKKDDDDDDMMMMIIIIIIIGKYMLKTNFKNKDRITRGFWK